MESLASNFEWYIAEISLPSPLPSEQPRVKLGPFVTEEEGRTVLESIKELPRFSHGNLELHKRGTRQWKRITMELSVHVRQFGANEMPQAAHTLDVSSSGARLGGLKNLSNSTPLFSQRVRRESYILSGCCAVRLYNSAHYYPNCKAPVHLEVICGEATAPFRVVWTGIPGSLTQDQVGVECLVPEANIWRLDGSQQSRRRCNIRKKQSHNDSRQCVRRSYDSRIRELASNPIDRPHGHCEGSPADWPFNRAAATPFPEISASTKPTFFGPRSK
jgi:hypothetical protein